MTIPNWPPHCAMNPNTRLIARFCERAKDMSKLDMVIFGLIENIQNYLVSGDIDTRDQVEKFLNKQQNEISEIFDGMFDFDRLDDGVRDRLLDVTRGSLYLWLIRF